jgi:hypothetical protein
LVNKARTIATSCLGWLQTVLTVRGALGKLVPESSGSTDVEVFVRRDGFVGHEEGLTQSGCPAIFTLCAFLPNF